MLRPSLNHGTQRLPNDDDDDDEIIIRELCWLPRTPPAERNFQLPVPSPDKEGGLASGAARF